MDWNLARYPGWQVTLVALAIGAGIGLSIRGVRSLMGRRPSSAPPPRFLISRGGIYSGAAISGALAVFFAWYEQPIAAAFWAAVLIWSLINVWRHHRRRG